VHSSARHHDSKHDDEHSQKCQRPQKPYPLKSNQEQKKQAEQKAKESAQSLTKQSNVRSRWRRHWNKGRWRWRLPPPLIIVAPHFPVLQNVVSLVERLHLFLTPATVRMAAGSHALVEAIQITRRRALIGSQDFVVIFLRIKLAHVIWRDFSFVPELFAIFLSLRISDGANSGVL
jgi:hypothetical protein